MTIITTRVEWHDIRIDPEDYPEEGEEVLVAVELLDGTRKTRANVYLKELSNGRYCWCERVYDKHTKQFEEAMVWYEVIAWAYYPEPYMK